MSTHDYLWSWLILCEYWYVIRCDHNNLIRCHVVFGFGWHLGTSHAWRSNPQTRWRYHRAIGWHKKRQINSCRLWGVWSVPKVRLELVLFVQVWSVFVFNHPFIGALVKVQLSFFILGLVTVHTWSLPTSITKGMMTISKHPPFGGTDWAHGASVSISRRCMVQPQDRCHWSLSLLKIAGGVSLMDPFFSGLRWCWRPFLGLQLCHVVHLMLAYMKDSWLCLVVTKQPNATCCEDHDWWYKEHFVMIPQAFRGWPIFLGGGAGFRILN